MEANTATFIGERDLVRFNQRAGTIENGASLPLFGFVLNNHLDAFMLREIANDLGYHPRDRLKFSRPVRAIVRPRQPGGCVRRPFGGHAKFCWGSQNAISTQRYREAGRNTRPRALNNLKTAFSEWFNHSFL